MVFPSLPSQFHASLAISQAVFWGSAPVAVVSGLDSLGSSSSVGFSFSQLVLCLLPKGMVLMQCSLYLTLSARAWASLFSVLVAFPAWPSEDVGDTSVYSAIIVFTAKKLVDIMVT